MTRTQLHGPTSTESLFRSLGREIAHATETFGGEEQSAANALRRSGLLAANTEERTTDHHALHWIVEGIADADVRNPATEKAHRHFVSQPKPTSNAASQAVDGLSESLLCLALTEVDERRRAGRRFELFAPGQRIVSFLERRFSAEEDPFARIATCVQSLFVEDAAKHSLLSAATLASCSLSPFRLAVARKCMGHDAVTRLLLKGTAIGAFLDSCSAGRLRDDCVSFAGLPLLVAFSVMAERLSENPDDWMPKLRQDSLRACDAVRQQIRDLRPHQWPETARKSALTFFALIEHLNEVLDEANAGFVDFFADFSASEKSQFDSAFLAARRAFGGCVPLNPYLVWVISDSMYPTLAERPAKDPIFDITLLMQLGWHWDEEIETAGAFDVTFEVFCGALRRMGFPLESSMSTAAHLFFLALEGPHDLRRPQRWRRRLVDSLPLDAGTTKLLGLAVLEATGRSIHLGKQLTSLIASTGLQLEEETANPTTAGAAQMEMKLSGRIGAPEWCSIPREARDALIDAEIEFVRAAPKLGERRKDFGHIGIMYAKAIEFLACTRLRAIGSAELAALDRAGIRTDSMTIGTVVKILRGAPKLRDLGLDLAKIGIESSHELAEQLNRFGQLRNVAAHATLAASKLVEVREAVPSLVKLLVSSGLAPRDAK